LDAEEASDHLKQRRQPWQGDIGETGAFSRLVDLPDDDCVQRRIMPFRARQVEVEQFDLEYP
jgi:hypothetical protein